MQIYADLPQITNKHPVAERAGIPHHLLGHVGWENSEYSVKEFEREALAKIAEIHARGKLPILVGGTHYYNQAVMFKNATIGGSGDAGDTPAAQKKTLTDEEQGILDGPSAGVLAKLREVDVDVANKFHPNDTRRIRRALEIYFQTGQRPSDIYEAQRTDNRNEKLKLRFDKTLVFWVWCEQSVLNPRLDTRVDAMLRNGLHDEIRELFQYYRAHRPEKLGGVYQVIGFKEFLPWLEAGGDAAAQTAGEPAGESAKLLQECVDKMKQRTRKYSKQQTKFMKNTLMPKLAEMVEEAPARTDIAAAVLDATDLTQWDTTVAARGIDVARAFLVPGENSSDPAAAVVRDHFIADTPALRSLLVTPKSFTREQWQNFTCDTCVDAETKEPIVVVGSDRWAVHLKSRKHRNAVAGRAKLAHNRTQMELRRKRQLEEEEEEQQAPAEPTV
jgi:tRNA dimethylallyltransferase